MNIEKETKRKHSKTRRTIKKQQHKNKPITLNKERKIGAMTTANGKQ